MRLIDQIFKPYMSRHDTTWDCSFFEELWTSFPTAMCRCCEGHLFFDCGSGCHVGFEAHGRACGACDNDRVLSLLRYENKMTIAGRRTLVASEFDNDGFVCYLVLTEASEDIQTFSSHRELAESIREVDVDVYQSKGDVYEDHN